MRDDASTAAAGPRTSLSSKQCRLVELPYSRHLVRRECCRFCGCCEWYGRWGNRERNGWWRRRIPTTDKPNADESGPCAGPISDAASATTGASYGRASAYDLYGWRARVRWINARTVGRECATRCTAVWPMNAPIFWQADDDDEVGL